MAVEVKDLVEKYGLNIEVTDDTTLDDIDKALGEKFKDKSLFEKEVSAQVGKKIGTAETKLRQLAGDDGKGKSFDELVELLPTSVANKIKAKEDEIESLKEKTKLTGKEAERLEKLESELKQTKDLLTAANEAKDAALTEKEKAALEGKTALEEYKLNLKLTNIYDGANWVDGVNDYTKIGLYKDKIEGKYIIKEVDGKLLVYKSDGETIETDGTAQMTYDKLVEKVLKEAKLFKLNGASGSKEKTEGKIDTSKIESPFVKANLEKAQAKAAALEAAEKK